MVTDAWGGMMEDLRSQLLKAGLVSEDQIKKAEKTRGKQRKQKKSKQARAVPDPEQARRQQELDEARARDREAQRQRHQARERQRLEKEARERAARERAEQARGIISGHGIALPETPEVSYNFQESGAQVRSIGVTRAQQQRLSQGDMGIARPHANLEQYVLLERKPALDLQAVHPEKLVLLHEPGDEDDEFGGLMW
jgi:uncharacterized protein YaiL (DUF2058 family)